MRIFLLSSLISLAWTQHDFGGNADFGGGMPGGGGIGGLGGPGPGTMDVADGGMDMAKMASLEGPGGRPDMAQIMAGLNAEGLGGAEGPGGMDMASMTAGMGGMGGAGDALTPLEPFPAVKTDVKFIACSTCKLLAERLHSQISKWDAKVTKSEESMKAKVADMCVTSSDAGSWITEYDMVESKDGKAVELKRQNEQGACEVECRTIAEACKTVVHEAEIELAAGLYMSFNGKKKKPLDLKALTSKLCTSDDAWAANVEGSCAAGVPKVPKKRKAGPAFRPKPPPPPPAPPPPPKKKAKAEAAPKTVAEVAAEGGETVAEVAAKTVAAVAAASKKDAKVAAAPKKDAEVAAAPIAAAPKKDSAPKKEAKAKAAPKKDAEANAEL